MGGVPGTMDVLLQITTGPHTTLSLGNPDTLVIQPLASANDQWTVDSSRHFSYWSQAPRAGQRDVLQPRQSVCVEQNFSSPDRHAPVKNVRTVRVTITLRNGNTERVSLRSRGGAGSVCGIGISG